MILILRVVINVLKSVKPNDTVVLIGFLRVVINVLKSVKPNDTVVLIG